MRIRIALLLCIMLFLCTVPPFKATDGTAMADASGIEWNAENVCWVERHYIASADEFSAFVNTKHEGEYARDGVRAPLVSEAYIGRDGAEKLLLSADEDWLIGIRTAIHIINADITIGESASVESFGSIYIESGCTLAVNGTLKNRGKEYVKGGFRLNCGIYVRDGGTLDARAGMYTGGGRLYKSANGAVTGIEHGGELRFSCAEELSAIIAQGCGEYAEIYADGAVTLDADCTLPNGAEIVIESGNSLNVAGGARLECSGSIWVNGGALTVDGGGEIALDDCNARVWANAEAGSLVNGQGLEDITAWYTRRSIASYADMEAATDGAYPAQYIHILDINTDVSIDRAWDIGENTLIYVHGGARLSICARTALYGALYVYAGAELNICAALTNEAYGSAAGVERGLCIYADGYAALGAGGEYAGGGQRRVYGSMDGFCHAETESGLNNALSGGAETVYISEDTVLTVTGRVYIPRGVRLVLLADARMSIADGALLVNMGTVEVCEGAALGISEKAQYIRGGAEKFTGTVTGLGAQPRLINQTTGQAVGLFNDASAEYAALCTDAVRSFDDMRLYYTLSMEGVEGITVTLGQDSALSAQCSLSSGGAAIEIYCGGAEAEEEICLNAELSGGKAENYRFRIRICANEGAYRLGDIDKDGRVSIRDAVLLCVNIANGDADADINGDGRLNIADAAALCGIILRG